MTMTPFHVEMMFSHFSLFTFFCKFSMERSSVHDRRWRFFYFLLLHLVHCTTGFKLSISSSTPSLRLFASIQRLDAGSFSIAGSDPDSAGKVNQDACFYSRSYGGVLDGHEKKGHVLNEFLKFYTPRILEDKISSAWQLYNYWDG